MAMPSTRDRVVCTFGETMLTFAPTRRLTSVDLPTLGDPTIATKPQRVVAASGPSSPAGPGDAPRPAPEGSSSRAMRRPDLHQHQLGGGAFGDALR